MVESESENVRDVESDDALYDVVVVVEVECVVVVVVVEPHRTYKHTLPPLQRVDIELVAVEAVEELQVVAVWREQLEYILIHRDSSTMRMDHHYLE